ncbi:MAG: hypothetical protein A2066_00830 [Bacteroidetes bacterium GWB2_41_8]|nr:MAG: hypothetical protein A2066_00830 [Bacteroidetes bacterium GWB2_41_8]
MTEKYIFIDFDGYKSISDLRKSIGERVFELKNHGFDDNQILKIVFEDNHFKECFISNSLWEQLKNEFTNDINYENTLKNSNIQQDHPI